MKLQEYIRTNFPFKKEIVKSSRRGKTLSEFRAEMDDEKFDEFMKETVSKRMRAMAYLSDTERKWIANHLPEFGGIMQHHISRMRYNRLPLLAYQKIWDDNKHMDDVSLALVEKVLEMYLSETPTFRRSKTSSKVDPMTN